MARKGRGERGRMAQIRAAYQMTKKVDPKILPILLMWGLGAFALILVLGFVIGQPIFFGIFGLMVGLLTMTITFGRRAERAAYSQVEGQVGAAAAVLNAIRRGWTITPGVAVAPRGQEMVHRAVGKPGIVLVAEGNSTSRIAGLLAAERRRMVRIASDTPVHEVVAGNGEGRVPLRKLQSHLAKLPRALRSSEVAAVNNRLRAVASGPPVPKGPMPKNVKLPRSLRGSNIRRM